MTWARIVLGCSNLSSRPRTATARTDGPDHVSMIPVQCVGDHRCPARPPESATTPTLMRSLVPDDRTQECRRRSQQMRQHPRSAGDGPSAPTRQPQAGAPTSEWTLTKLARRPSRVPSHSLRRRRVDMRLTGRPGSDTPLRTFEAVRRRRLRSPGARAAVGYAVQSSLAPAGAIATAMAGEQVTRRFVAAALTPLAVVGTVGPALGASARPWCRTRSDWTREFALKSVACPRRRGGPLIWRWQISQRPVAFRWRGSCPGRRVGRGPSKRRSRALARP